MYRKEHRIIVDCSSNFLKVNGVRIHYYRTGGNKPPIVLAHGITDDGLCWARLAKALESEYDVIMPDARGHGNSDAPEASYSPDDHAADLAGLIDSLKLDNPVLVGHSMGAATVGVVAGTYTGMAACIVLEDPPWPAKNYESEQEHQAVLQRWRRDILEDKKKTIEELLSYCRKKKKAWTDADYGPWADSKRSVSPNVVDFVAVRRNWEKDAKRIDCPALLVTGDVNRGAIVTPEYAKRLMNLNNMIRTVRIARAGHSIHRDQFEIFLTEFRRFVLQEGRDT